MLENKEFKESFFWNDIKMFLAAICCVLGYISHWGPVKWPENKQIIAGCLAGYAICQVFYYYIENFKESSAFFIAT